MSRSTIVESFDDDCEHELTFEEELELDELDDYFEEFFDDAVDDTFMTLSRRCSGDYAAFTAAERRI